MFFPVFVKKKLRNGDYAVGLVSIKGPSLPAARIALRRQLQDPNNHAIIDGMISWGTYDSTQSPVVDLKLEVHDAKNLDDGTLQLSKADYKAFDHVVKLIYQQNDLELAKKNNPAMRSEAGEHTVSIFAVPEKGRVMLQFPISMDWLSLSPESAIKMANHMIKCANELKNAKPPEGPL